MRIKDRIKHFTDFGHGRSRLARLYPKLRTRFSLSGKNPGFLANTFSTSQIIDEVKKVKLLSHKGFSHRKPVAKKMDKVELREKLAIASSGRLRHRN